MLCMRTGRSVDPQDCTKLNAKTGSGHQKCDRMGVTQALDHTWYQPQIDYRDGRNSCERMGATQALNHMKYQHKLEQKATTHIVQTDLLDQIDLSGPGFSARFSVKLVASSDPAELSPSPHQLLCSYLRADHMEKHLHLCLFLSAAELVMFFPALSSCYEAPDLLHSQLVANQLVDISVRSNFSQISYDELVCLLLAGLLNFKLIVQTDLLDQIDLSGLGFSARFSVKIVASSAPAELSPSPHQLLCSYLRADHLEQLLHLRLFLSATELVLFFPALSAATRLQLCSIPSWSTTSWLIYLEDQLRQQDQLRPDQEQIAQVKIEQKIDQIRQISSDTDQIRGLRWSITDKIRTVSKKLRAEQTGSIVNCIAAPPSPLTIRRLAPPPPPPPRVAGIRSGQLDEVNPFVQNSSVLLVQADEGVSVLVVDRIGDIYRSLPRRADVIVTTVGARHKCQQGSGFEPPMYVDNCYQFIVLIVSRLFILCSSAATPGGGSGSPTVKIRSELNELEQHITDHSSTT
ncbi:hypothetical protein F511_26707 [Dorcoceras hygrometricum]|uniref:Uncharacterized protein n=1 Tax=Dorcoceras hygrometricum TaxID=472368 RepID=A0A2Z7C632_9LAMI|nr:hypothetical protein F511_26707 [Dorcoceras hygrometricum]